MKLVISDSKTGKTYQTEIPKDNEGSVIGLKIGADFETGVAPGYKLKVTGGSDKDGVPMRGDVSGGRRTYVILSDGPGVRTKESGERRGRSVRGNIVTAEIAQLNTMVVSAGEKKLDELFPPKPKEEKKE